MATKKLKGLGRGLEALLGGDGDFTQQPADAGAPSSLPVAQLQAGKYQPRTRMDEGALNELAASIKSAGHHAAGAGAAGRAAGRRDALRDHRRRAPLPRRAAGRARPDPGAGARRRRPGRRGDGADRKHPARRPQSAGRSAGHPPPDRRFQFHPRAGRACGRPFAQRGVEPAAPDEPGRSRCRPC